MAATQNFRSLFFRLALWLLPACLAAGFSTSCKPKCPIPGCQVRMQHYHGDTGGKANPLRGSKWYQRQHPMYGHHQRRALKPGEKRK